MANYYANAPLPNTNSRQVAQTIRQASTALLTIDSEDRYANFIQARAGPTSPYNFAITKTESLMPGFMTRIGITEVVFPWVIPNINTKTSEITLQYQVGAAPIALLPVSIIPGFNTPAQIAALIQAFVAVTIPTFTMTYGSGDDPVFAYESGAPGTTVAFLPLAYNSAAYPYPSTTKQLFDLLGFTNKNSILATGGNGVYTLAQGFRYIDIVCNQLTNSQAQKDQTSQAIARDMLCRIYLGDGGGTGQSTVQASNAAFSPPGCAPMTIYRSFPFPKQIQWIPNQNIPGYLQFSVYDDAGAPLDEAIALVGGGAPGLAYTTQALEWSMTMQVSES
jgi:hypothetical protein